MRIFDTKVQYLKYKVLREVARQAWAETLSENAIDIPRMIVPGKVPTMRCCVYKERAILAERVKLATHPSLYPGHNIFENVPKYTTYPSLSKDFNEGKNSPSYLNSP